MFDIDYCGQEDLFVGAVKKCSAGEEVELIYDMIMTDTDYTFYVDGRKYNAKWDNKRCAYIIRFVMPHHNISVYCESNNTSVKHK